MARASRKPSRRAARRARENTPRRQTPASRVPFPPVMQNPPEGRQLTNAECIEVIKWLIADLDDAARQAGLRK